MKRFRHLFLRLKHTTTGTNIAITFALVTSTVIAIILLPAAPARTEHLYTKQPTRPAAPPTAQQVRAMGSAFSSGSETEIREVIALPDGQQIQSEALQALASEAISFDTATFRDSHNGTATIQATVRSNFGQTSVWSVRLLNIDGRWKVSDTEPRP